MLVEETGSEAQSAEVTIKALKTVCFAKISRETMRLIDQTKQYVLIVDFKN